MHMKPSLLAKSIFLVFGALSIVSAYQSLTLPSSKAETRSSATFTGRLRSSSGATAYQTTRFFDSTPKEKSSAGFQTACSFVSALKDDSSAGATGLQTASYVSLALSLRPSSGVTGFQTARSFVSALKDDRSADATGLQTTSYVPLALRLRSSSGVTGFQTARSFHQTTSYIPSIITSSPASVVSDLQTTFSLKSSLKETKSSNFPGFQTAANFSEFVLRLSPSSGATGFSISSSASVLRLNSPSHTTAVQTTTRFPDPVITEDAVGFSPGDYSASGKPLPLLAKILIPVAGVLLVAAVVITWCCCVRRKESGNFDNLLIESTLMVRLDVSENRRLSC